MKDKAREVSTRELWARLFQAPSVDLFLSGGGGDCPLPSFSEYITQLCEDRGVRPEAVVRRGDIERSFGHRLFSGARNPSRDTVLQLAFGFGLTADETQQLLKVARATPLHPKVKRDAVIAYCLHGRRSLVDAQECLEKYGLPLIGGKRNGIRS